MAMLAIPFLDPHFQTAFPQVLNGHAPAWATLQTKESPSFRQSSDSTYPGRVIPERVEQLHRFETQTYVSLDAEFVGIGADGLASALARVSICDYEGNVLLDTFCRPDQPVTDYRSWVSGVRECDLERAPCFSIVRQQVQDAIKGKILVGHAVHNDLEVLGLSHEESRTRDTASYVPLQQLAGTAWPSLRALAKLVLDLNFQTGEHSSVEDARVTMSIFRIHQKEWEQSISSPQSSPRPMLRPASSTFRMPSFSPSPHYSPVFGMLDDGSPFRSPPIPHLPFQHLYTPDSLHPPVFSPFGPDFDDALPPRVNLPTSPVNASRQQQQTSPVPLTSPTTTPGKLTVRPTLPSKLNPALDPRFSAANSILPPLRPQPDRSANTTPSPSSSKAALTPKSLPSPSHRKSSSLSWQNGNGQNTRGKHASASSSIGNGSPQPRRNRLSNADSDSAWRETAKTNQINRLSAELQKVDLTR